MDKRKIIKRDYTGEVYGAVTVVSLDYVNKSGHTYWICLCKCGETFPKRGNSLKSNNKGCNNCSGYKKDFGVSAFNTLYKTYINVAKLKSLEFNIAKEEFKELIKQNCSYCNSEPCNILKTRSNNGNCVYTGLDRVDSNQGYFLNNVVPSCIKCNAMKRNLKKDIFIGKLIKIYNNMDLKNGRKERSK